MVVMHGAHGRENSDLIMREVHGVEPHIKE